MMLRSLTLTLLLTLAAAGAVAQQPARQVLPPPPSFAAMRGHEADDLATVLGLSPAQRPALNAWLSASHPDRLGGPEADGPLPDQPLTFEEEMARRERAIARRSDDERRRLAADRAFYAQLDKRQRAVFEALGRLRRPGPGGPGLHRGPPDGGGPIGGPPPPQG